MAYTYHGEVSDGVRTTYAVKFPYLNKTDVFVYVGGYENWADQMSYRWVDDQTIELLQVGLEAPVDTKFTIRRVTARDKLEQVFENRAIRGWAVDRENLHALYLIQELADGFLSENASVLPDNGGGGDTGGGGGSGGGSGSFDDAHLKHRTIYRGGAGTLPKWAAAVADTRAEPIEYFFNPTPTDGEEVTVLDRYDNAATNNITTKTAQEGATIDAPDVVTDGGSKMWRYEENIKYWRLVFKNAGRGGTTPPPPPPPTDVVEITGQAGAPTFSTFVGLATNVQGTELGVFECGPSNQGNNQVYHYNITDKVWTDILAQTGAPTIVGEVYGGDMSSDGNTFAFTDYDVNAHQTIVHVYDWGAGTWVSKTIPNSVNYVALTADGSKVFCLEPVPNKVHAWDLVTDLVTVYTLNDYVVDLDCSPEGGVLYFVDNITNKVLKYEIGQNLMTDITGSTVWDYPFKVQYAGGMPWALHLTNTDKYELWAQRTSEWGKIYESFHPTIYNGEPVVFCVNEARNKQFFGDLFGKIWIGEELVDVTPPPVTIIGDKFDGNVVANIGVENDTIKDFSIKAGLAEPTNIHVAVDPITVYEGRQVIMFSPTDAGALKIGPLPELNLIHSPEWTMEFIGLARPISGIRAITATANNSHSGAAMWADQNGQLEFKVAAAGDLVIATEATTHNEWVHYALSMDATKTLRMFKDGRQIGQSLDVTTHIDFTPGDDHILLGGFGWDNASLWGGMISQFRVTVDVCRYTAPFTPPKTFPTQRPTEVALPLLNGNAEAGTANWNIEANVLGIRTASPSPYEGTQYFSGSGYSSVRAASDQVVLGTAAEVDALIARGAYLRVNWRQSSYRGDDCAAVHLRQMDAQGNIVHTQSSHLRSVEQTDWSSRSLATDLVSGTVAVVVVMEFLRKAGSNNDGYIDDIKLSLVN